MGYLLMQSSHGLPRNGCFTVRSARHTALLHLKPEPKAICHTRSPRFTRSFASMYASSYHKELLEVLPNLLVIPELEQRELGLCKILVHRMSFMKKKMYMLPIFLLWQWF
jgi:hypothetical protein